MNFEQYRPPRTPPGGGPQNCNWAQSPSLGLHDHDDNFADNAEFGLHPMESPTSTPSTPQMSRTNSSCTQGHWNKPITPGIFEHGHNSSGFDNMSDTSGPVCHPNSSYLLSSLWEVHWEPSEAFVPSTHVVLDETQCCSQPTFLKQDVPLLRSDASYSRELPTGNRVPDDTPSNSTRLDEHSPKSNGYSQLAPDSMANTAPNLVPQQLPRGPKRRPFSDATLRWQTAETRKIGSCIRCTMQRIRCKSNPVDPRGECLTCRNLTDQSRHHFPCMRYKLTSLRLIKPEYARSDHWIRSWNDMLMNPMQSWAAVQAKRIRISGGLGNKYIEVFVREFVSSNRGKRMQGEFDTSDSCSILSAAYDLADLKACEEAYANYIPEVTGSALKQFSGPPDQLLHQTYRLACQICQDRTTPDDSLQLLGLAFKLWTAVRLLTIPTFIVADTTFDQAGRFAGRTPVPPVVSAQMQIALMHYIQASIRPDLISKLRSMMCPNRKDAWLTMYLATFILLHNLTLLMAHDAGEERLRGTNPSTAADVREYVQEANTLLAHFHYCSRGMFPLSRDCKDRSLHTIMGLDTTKIQFLRYCSAFAEQHDVEWMEVRRRASYEHSYFLISQLFDADWRPWSA